MRVLVNAAKKLLMLLGFLSATVALAPPHPIYLNPPTRSVRLQKSARGVTRKDDPQDWRHLGNCTTTDPELFFSEREEDQRQARLVCLGCPVQRECLEYAMVNPVEGIWAGMDEEERRDYYPQWAREQGRAKVQAVRDLYEVEDRNIANARPSSEARFGRRLDKAKVVRQKLLDLPEFDTGTRHRYMRVLEAIIAEPLTGAPALASRMGKSATWFNTTMREACELVGVPVK